MNLYTIWTDLTEAQASLIASAATVISALIVAILGPLIFRGAVKGIEDARDKAKEAAESIKVKFDELTEQLSSLTQSLANVQNRVEEVVVAEQASAQPDAQSDPEGEKRREKIREEWGRLQRQAESLAAAPWVDGRTQGKYTRIDRRNYVDLLRALDHDRNLAGSMQDWERALNLWYTFRARNTPPPSDDNLAEMITLRAKLENAIEVRRQTREDEK